MVFIGDIGTEIKIDTGEDISSATGVSITYLKPVSKDTGTWVAAVDGTQVVLYTTDAGDFDEAGIWRVQAVITFSATSIFQTTIGEIYVAPAL